MGRFPTAAPFTKFQPQVLLAHTLGVRTLPASNLRVGNWAFTDRMVDSLKSAATVTGIPRNLGDFLGLQQ